MLVQGVNLCNFRNYSKIELGCHPSLNIFIGDNAQGKTNILESLFYSLTGKSHRTNYDHELISWGKKFLNITLSGKRANSNIKIEIIVRADDKKILKVNGQVKKKLSELIGIINVVMFSPEDMMLVKGGPSVRRKFLDMEISQTSPFYCYTLANYNKVLAQRNNLLKLIRENKESKELLDVFDSQLVEYGTYLIKKRNEVIKKLAPIAAKYHSDITSEKEKLNIAYKPSVNISEENNYSNLESFYNNLLKENRNMEIIKGVTVTGPHRDDLNIKIGNIDLRNYGSQGQQRTSALSLKMSEVEFMKMEAGEYPILLLDDVMSELDSSRRKYLLEAVMGKMQTFVTSTEIDELFGPVKKTSRIFEVNSGKISTIQEG